MVAFISTPELDVTMLMIFSKCAEPKDILSKVAAFTLK